MDLPSDNLITAPIRTRFQIDKISRKAPIDMKANHYHDAYEIYYLCSGERYYFIHDRTYRIEAGDLVMINKHVIHRTLNLSKAHERFVINFRDDLFEGMPEVTKQWNVLDLFEKPVVRLNRKQKAFVETLLHKMLDEYESTQSDSEAYCKLMLAELLLYAGRCKREQIEEQEHAAAENPMFERISSIADYINSRYTEPLSLELLAGQFHINPFYLSRIFKKVTGFTFVEYVNQVRLKEARKLLLDCSFSVTKVAEAVGFESLSHFGRVFKSSTGMSPRDFRKTYGEE